MFSLQQQARTSRCGSSGAPRRSSSSAVVSARRKTTTSKRLSPLRASNNNAFSHSFGASSWRPDGGDDAATTSGLAALADAPEETLQACLDLVADRDLDGLLAYLSDEVLDAVLAHHKEGAVARCVCCAVQCVRCCIRPPNTTTSNTH